MADDTRKMSAFDYNMMLFEKFYHDLENGLLPDLPEPTQEMILEGTKKREEELRWVDKHYPAGKDFGKRGEMQRANAEVPVMVNLWVKQMMEYYFADMRDMLGMTGLYGDAKKRLYELRGYSWYTTQEIYPGLLID